MLDAGGELPAMRTEEILWRCAAALDATDKAAAGPLRARARAVIERKAATLRDPAHQSRYLALPLNQEILDTTGNDPTTSEDADGTS